MALLWALVPALSWAQERTTRHLDWRPAAPPGERTAQAPARSQTTEVRDQGPVTSFDRAFFDATRQDLPYYHEVVPLKPGSRSFTVELENARYVTMTPAERDAMPGLGTPGPRPEVRTHLGWMRKRPHALVDIYPYRSGPGGVERLVDFDLRINESPSDPGTPGRPKSYPSTSRLATGDWYRMQVSEDGVYVLTQEQLAAMGADVDGLASDAINIYGNHFGQLPYQNSVARPTDLVPNAIRVEDGGDGTFDPGDRILFRSVSTWR